MRFVNFTRSGSGPCYGPLHPGDMILDLPKAAARARQARPATLTGPIAAGNQVRHMIFGIPEIVARLSAGSTQTGGVGVLRTPIAAATTEAAA